MPIISITKNMEEIDMKTTRTHGLNEREMELVKLLMADCESTADIQAKLKKLFARWELLLILVIVLEFVIFGSLTPKFLNLKRLFSGLNQFIPVCIIS